MSLYQARSISKEFITGDDSLSILRDVSLDLNPGEMTAIVGASGSGKTTLLQILGTLATPTEGELLFKGEDLCQKTEKELAAIRNTELGFIFQFHHLLPEFTTLENVMMPALINGKTAKDIDGAARGLLDQVELGHRINHKVGELSGGEQQRAALARALIMQPKILLADEPTGNLDSRSGNLVFELLFNLCKNRSLTTLMVTHNMELAGRMDHAFTLQDGVFKP